MFGERWTTPATERHPDNSLIHSAVPQATNNDRKRCERRRAAIDSKLPDNNARGRKPPRRASDADILNIRAPILNGTRI
ncbi:hypothetical protein G9C98_006277 [Cotesia typhae]|uniref:Uncharacterized protein n=1 Tax=Cotesia typhae TaxID=2053667 RepID=A0A8J5UZ67_9HYME|nr:hypothetical protein G9C98_006277 [Cotesia typhae]